MAVSRPYIHWQDLSTGTIRAESPISSSYWDFYKRDGSGWTLITSKAVTGTQIDVTLADLSITSNTELMVRQRDAVNRSPDSNVMSIIVENWTESTSYTVVSGGSYRRSRFGGKFGGTFGGKFSAA